MDLDTGFVFNFIEICTYIYTHARSHTHMYTHTHTPAVLGGQPWSRQPVSSSTRFYRENFRNLTPTGNKARKDRCGRVCVGSCVRELHTERQRICNREHVRFDMSLL